MKLFRLACYFILFSLAAALPAPAKDSPFVLKRELPPQPPDKYQRVYLADSSLSVDMPAPDPASDRLLRVGGREMHFVTIASFPPISATNLNTQYIFAYADLPKEMTSKNPNFSAARLVDDVHEAYFGVPKTIFKPNTSEEHTVGQAYFRKMSVKLPDTEKIAHFQYIYEHNRVYLLSVLAEAPNPGVEDYLSSLVVEHSLDR
ncbi:MAG: hypothetical protein ACM3U1_04315 [Chloroflexota bacterium]